MTMRRPVKCVLAAVVLALPTSTALALTADELWTEWQRLARIEGAEITASARREGDQLVLTDIVIPIGPPNDLADLRVGRIALQENRDGSVAVLLPERFPVTIEARRRGLSGPDQVTLSAAAPGFAMTVRGIGDRAAFDIAAPSLSLVLDQAGPALGAVEQLDFNLAAADLAVTYQMDPTQPFLTATSALRLGTLHLDALFEADQRRNDRVTLSLDLSGLAWGLDMAMPSSVLDTTMNGGPAPDESPALFLATLADGMRFKTDLSFGAFAFAVDVNEFGERTKIEVTSDGGRASAGLDVASGGYDLALERTEMSIQGNAPQLAFSDLTLGFAAFAYGLSLGIGDLVSPQEARFAVRLIDFNAPPELWAELDPTGALGPSPLSVALEVLARYALSPEMLEPGWQPAPDAFPPIDIIDVTLNELRLSMYGMQVSGEGALAFDETDLTSFDGMPAPEGELSFQATGFYAFLDQFAAAGLVPAADLTALRMGLMFIAKAGEGPDSLTSQIAFRDKSLYLNGLKIR